MISLRKELSTVFFILLGTAASLFILLQYNHAKNKNIFFTSAAPFLAPTSAPEKVEETSTVISPDGTSKLTMKKLQKDATTTYSFLTRSETGSREQLIFYKTIPFSQSFTIPFNTWSPDNKYVFLKESTPAGDVYYVFNASGESFADNSRFINVSDLFSQKLPDYTVTEMTGWADPYLVIINTKTKDGKQGPSFWFEIPSRSFIQLSTHFG